MILGIPTRPFRTPKKKDVLFIIWDLNAKVESQEIPGKQARSIKWNRTKANRVCQENTLVIANTLLQQHKRQLYTWTLTDGQYWNQIDYILCSQRWRSSMLLLLLLLLSHFSPVWLCDPIDGSSPGAPVPGILQARTLEWVAISFSQCMKVKSGEAP